MLFLLLTLNKFMPFSSLSIVDCEQVNVSWVRSVILSTCQYQNLYVYRPPIIEG